MLVAALLLGTTPACPAPIIPFSPPLDRALLLERQIERELRQGRFTQQVQYRLQFARAGRGYRLNVRQIAQHAEGPPELLRMLALQEASAQDESLDIVIDATGRILGITEAPDAAARLGAAIARLRADAAVSARPESERAQIGALLDRLASMTPDERGAMHRARFGRLLMFAGQPCSQAVVMLSNTESYRIIGASADSLELETVPHSQAGDEAGLLVEDRIALSSVTGLVTGFDRKMRSTAAASQRKARESLRLYPDP